MLRLKTEFRRSEFATTTEKQKKCDHRKNQKHAPKNKLKNSKILRDSTQLKI